ELDSGGTCGGSRGIGLGAGHELRKVNEKDPELRVIRARGQSWSRKMLAGAEERRCPLRRRGLAARLRAS
ncbi:MAG: hypothetical protein QOJ47_856, partial [Gaiellales bacterium]|nr:hypothetical protein [Gaiellales bacterium]